MFAGSFTIGRLLLRPITPTDADAIFRSYARDLEVTRFLTWRPHAEVGQVEAYIARCLGRTDARTMRSPPMRTAHCSGPSTCVAPWPGGWNAATCWRAAHWGRGLMSEALCAVADWARRQPGIWRIGAVCDVDNTASARVMEKAGLRREGLPRRWIVHPNLGGAPRDCLSYARVH